MTIEIESEKDSFKSKGRNMVISCKLCVRGSATVRGIRATDFALNVDRKFNLDLRLRAWTLREARIYRGKLAERVSYIGSSGEAGKACSSISQSNEHGCIEISGKEKNAH